MAAEEMINNVQTNQEMGGDNFKPGLALSLCLFLGVFSVYAATLAGVLLVHSEPLRWLLAFINGFVVTLLAIIGHDAAHQSFFPIKQLNHFFGRLAFLPGLIPFSTWAYEHHTQHHRYTNWAQKDITWNPFSYSMFVKLPAWRQTLERIYRTPLGTGLYWIREFWWKRHMVPEKYIREEMKKNGTWRRHKKDVATVCLFIVFQCVFIVWLNKADVAASLYLMAVAVLVPHLVFTWLAGLLIFVQHTSPQTVWYEKENEWKQNLNQALMSTHVVLPYVLEKILLDITSHSAHHTHPNVPVYRLAARQKQLEKFYEGHVPVHSFSIGWLTALFRDCQLYDFDRHQWLNFQGRPTTPAVELK